MGGGAGVVNPLVNTQFQYLDVGVNIDVTPRVHPDNEVSMKLTVDISSIAGTSNIGGINQPVITAEQDRTRRPAEGRRSERPGRIDPAHGNEKPSTASRGWSQCRWLSICFRTTATKFRTGSVDRPDAAHHSPAVHHGRKSAHDGGWNGFERARVSRGRQRTQHAPAPQVQSPRRSACGATPGPGSASATGCQGRRDSRGRSAASFDPPSRDDETRR